MELSTFINFWRLSSVENLYILYLNIFWNYFGPLISQIIIWILPRLEAEVLDKALKEDFTVAVAVSFLPVMWSFLLLKQKPANWGLLAFLLCPSCMIIGADDSFRASGFLSAQLEIHKETACLRLLWGFHKIIYVKAFRKLESTHYHFYKREFQIYLLFGRYSLL